MEYVLVLLSVLVAWFSIWRTSSPHSRTWLGRTKNTSSKSSKKNAAQSASNAHHWKGKKEFELGIVGDSYSQDAIGKIATEPGFDGSGVIAHLVPEKNGKKTTESAVRIEVQGTAVGYLSEDHAKNFHRQLGDINLSNQVTTCNAQIRTDRKEGNAKAKYNVFLDMNSL